MMERFSTHPSTPVTATQRRHAEEPLPFDQDLRRKVLGRDAFDAIVTTGDEQDSTTTERNARPDATAALPPEQIPAAAMARRELATATSVPAPEPEDMSAERIDIWPDLKAVTPGTGSVFARLGRTCEDPVAREFDILRTEVLQVLRSEGWKRIGIVAPRAGCGTTFTALNLACGLARVEQFRTLLVDLNQRTPSVHRDLDLPWRGAIADLLDGDYHVSKYARRYSDTLAVLMNAATSDASADVLHRPRTAAAIDAITETLAPDAVLFDLPPMLEYDDLSAFAPNLDAVLIVASAESTSSEDLLECERKLSGIVPLLGVVLNKTEAGRS